MGTCTRTNNKGKKMKPGQKFRRWMQRRKRAKTGRYYKSRRRLIGRKSRRRKLHELHVLGKNATRKHSSNR